MPPQTGRKSGGILESSAREPREPDASAFARLFGDAYRTCFSAPFTTPLTESESHRFSVEIAESTGLEIGWKSLKNYSSYLLGAGGRTENPSVPTLDTLARYVAGAPPTTEERRRTHERHYPYWFRYRDALRQTETVQAPSEPPETARSSVLRFLSSAGAMNNAAFREVGRAEFAFRPAYVAVFAIEGFVTPSADAPVSVDAFSLAELPCSP